MKKLDDVKFFCENCGKEVKRNASICPHCGRLFASVKCPACNYAGSASQFSNGCPRCGYALHSSLPKTKDDKRKRKTPKSKRGSYDEALPIWLYALVFCIFIVVVLIVLFH